MYSSYLLHVVYVALFLPPACCWKGGLVFFLQFRQCLFVIQNNNNNNNSNKRQRQKAGGRCKRSFCTLVTQPCLDSKGFSIVWEVVLASYDSSSWYSVLTVRSFHSFLFVFFWCQSYNSRGLVYIYMSIYVTITTELFDQEICCSVFLCVYSYRVNFFGFTYDSKIVMIIICVLFYYPNMGIFGGDFFVIMMRMCYWLFIHEGRVTFKQPLIWQLWERMSNFQTLLKLTAVRTNVELQRTLTAVRTNVELQRTLTAVRTNVELSDKSVSWQLWERISNFQTLLKLTAVRTNVKLPDNP